MKNSKNERGFISVFAIFVISVIAGFSIALLNLSHTVTMFQRKTFGDFEATKKIFHCLVNEMDERACHDLRLTTKLADSTHRQVFIQVEPVSLNHNVEVELEKKWELWQIKYWKE